jgi:hypothetical protein
MTIDRNNYGVALSAMIVVAFTATRKFADTGIISTGGTGGTANNRTVVLQADLKGANRYVRFDYTPQLSAASTDTLRDQAIGIMHCLGRLPSH